MTALFRRDRIERADLFRFQGPIPRAELDVWLMNVASERNWGQ
jgi:hypothetical protein